MCCLCGALLTCSSNSYTDLKTECSKCVSVQYKVGTFPHKSQGVRAAECILTDRVTNLTVVWSLIARFTGRGQNESVSAKNICSVLILFLQHRILPITSATL